MLTHHTMMHSQRVGGLLLLLPLLLQQCAEGGMLTNSVPDGCFTTTDGNGGTHLVHCHTFSGDTL